VDFWWFSSAELKQRGSSLRGSCARGETSKKERRDFKRRERDVGESLSLEGEGTLRGERVRELCSVSPPAQLPLKELPLSSRGYTPAHTH